MSSSSPSALDSANRNGLNGSGGHAAGFHVGHHARHIDGDVAISVHDLAKCYTIVHEEKQNSILRATARRLKNPLYRPKKEQFWALNGVSFEVRRGDVVGIIGRNGAGKSTLLKLLSRITEPTRGEAVLRGRVGSLLEVGTGFHPELTGRENIFLNGAILGMTRQEIDRQFDAIVDFSGAERFLDTPVKRYSSGMYVRLAFAVAAHLNPEILIVDEVLAVGDGDFQKKCLGKMHDVASSGRTVLFVSHAMNSVLALCNRCVYLKGGTVVADGPSAEVVDTYIRSGSEASAETRWDLHDAPGNDQARLLAVRILDPDGQVNGNLSLSDAVGMEMDYTVEQSGLEITPSFHVYNAHNVCMFSSFNAVNQEWMRKSYETGVYRARCTIPRNLLNAGQYKVTVQVARDTNVVLAKCTEAVTFELHEDGTGRGVFTGELSGVLRPHLDWQFDRIGGAPRK